MQIKTEGLVIMEKTVGESDRLVTVLTKSDGLVHAFVKGAKSLKNKNSISTQLFCYSRLVIYKGREKYIIDEATPIEVFFSLRDSIEKLALAQYFCELTIALASEHYQANDFLRLILNSLYYLSNDKKDRKIIKAVFEMRIMALAGYMPNLVCCDSCAKYEDKRMFFVPYQGKIECSECFFKHGNIYSLPLNMGALTALRHSIYAEFKKIFSFELLGESLDQFSAAAEEYVKATLDRKFKTLDFYHNVC